MRDLLIVAIVVIGAVIALRRPWVGVLLWTWLSIMNPHRYSWGIAFDAPLAAIAAGSTLLGLLFTKERQSLFQGAPTVIFFLLALWVTISWLMGIDVAGDYDQWGKVIKIFLMTFIALVLLDHKQKLIIFVWVTVMSLAILGAKGGLFTILTGGGYRVWGPPGSFVADNNHFALALIMTIPLLHFLQLQIERAKLRHVMSVVMLLCAAAAIGSYSRGALLAIFAMTALLWWRSERKGLIGMAIIFVVLVFLPIMPETWWERMSTIKSYDEDGSAMGRINAWLVAWEVAKTHLFGSGMSYQHQVLFSMYGMYETTVRAAHSIYFQILGNHGFIGLIIYLLLWITTYSYAGWLRKTGKLNPATKWASDLGAMAQVSLIGFAVGGSFLSMAYFDLSYNIMVMVVLARRWIEKRAWEYESSHSIKELLGFQRRT